MNRSSEDSNLPGEPPTRVPGAASQRQGRGWILYVCAVVLVVGALVLVDRSDSDTANQGALMLLLIFAAALGWLRPRQAWLSALVVGSTFAAARAIGLLTGHVPTDPQAPHSLPAAATLLVLVLPAAVAAYLGAAARRTLTPADPTSEPPTSR